MRTKLPRIAGELAAKRLPNIKFAERETEAAPTLRQWSERWKASRIDVSAGTAKTYATNLDRVLGTLGDHQPAAITPADVAELVGELHRRGLRRESIRKTLSTVG